ncbi:ABC transporter family substrate-binding protein [Rothia sp. P7181]|uniref:ABC transporter family substrate-binding protein n=1 Tax=unclassified Rothia (in: high G+C Gram-positive bacteria) TaxID=2689056 RepID=UPI003ABEEC5D
MRISRRSSIIGFAAVSALALSSCASTGNNASSSSGDKGSKSVSMAIVNTFSSLNSNSADGNVDTNGMIANMTTSGFYSINNKLEVVHNDWFGTYEESDKGDGMEVKYTVKDDMKWSDGNEIGEGDLLLAWAVLSGHFDDSEKDLTYFSYAGDTAGLGNAGVPVLSDNGKTITFTYPQKFADWEVAYDIVATPAHVVAKLAGMDEDKLVEVIKNAKPGEENADLRKIADAWNTGFNTTTMPSEDLIVCNGPYKLDAVVENQSVTLVANENYQGPKKPAISEITLKILPDAAAQIQALKNGDVDVITPQASIDTVSQAKALDNAETHVAPDLSYDHLDLNFHSDVFKDENVRKAFLLTIPRQDVVDKLIKPMQPDAVVLNSELFVVSQGKAYEEAVKQNNSSEYPTTDPEANIAKAKELLNGATPTVKILYNNKNSNRENTFQMIKEAAGKAGFKVESLGSEQWASELSKGPEGYYDASIFGWVSPGVGHESLGQIFATDGGSNFTGYSNATVDEDAKKVMSTVDNAEIQKVLIQADGELFKDGYGLPLFQSPSLVAYNKSISGIDPKPGQYPATWNIVDWDIK